MTKVSLITLEYNSAQHTAEFLKSLEQVKLTDVQLEVIIVDNASEERTEHLSDKLSLTLLRSRRNKGFTGGNNFGIKTALKKFDPDYILLINNDTLVDPNFLTELINCAKSNKDVGIVAPMIYFAEGYEFHKKSYSKEEKGKVVWFAGGSIDWQNMYAFHRGVDEVDRGQFQLPVTSYQFSERKNIPSVTPETMDFVTGCCMLIPTKVLNEVGLFNNSYFLYWEDVELSQRIREAGYELYFCPKSKVWHKNAGSSGGSGSDLHRKYQERNRLRFAFAYAPLRTKMAVLRQYLSS